MTARDRGTGGNVGGVRSGPTPPLGASADRRRRERQGELSAAPRAWWKAATSAERRSQRDAQRDVPAIGIGARTWASDDRGQAVRRGDWYRAAAPTSAPEAPPTPAELEAAGQLAIDLGASQAPESAAGEAAEPRGVRRGGVTVNPTECLTEPGSGSFFDDVDRAVEDWRWRRVELHEGIARRARKAGDRDLARWHEGRARTLTRRFVVRRSECCAAGGPWIELSCSKCGTVHAMPIRCGLRQWCSSCAGARAGGLRKRLVRSFGAARRRALADWTEAGSPRGKRPELTLLTLTIRHSGDVARDRANLQRAWERLRAWLWHSIGSPAFVRTTECTRGRDGLGHLHFHVIALLPRLDLRALDREWLRATEGEGVNVDVVGPNRAALRSPRARKTRKAGVHAAAEYVTKYATKGVSPLSLDVPTAAAWVRAMHGRRMVTTSRAFLVAPEPAPTKCDHAACAGGILQGPPQFHNDGWQPPAEEPDTPS